MSADPIAYAYDADLHCAGCAVARFGTEPGRPWPPEDARAGSDPIGAVAPWDPMPCHSVCGTCGEELPGAECLDSGTCCAADGCCADGRCCGPRAKVRERWAHGGMTGRYGYSPTYHGDLWHALTGRTAPERGQLTLTLEVPA